jgi:hypothetical protein
MSLREIRYDTGEMRYPDRRRRVPAPDLTHYLDLARTEVAAARTRRADAVAPPETTADFEELRWFPYPHEILSG